MYLYIVVRSASVLWFSQHHKVHRSKLIVLNFIQSDTFADGEKPESPAPHVGEVLSREGSPKPAAEEEHAFTPPVPESPREEAEGDGTFDVQDLEEEIISPEQDRETLVEMYHVSI